MPAASEPLIASPPLRIGSPAGEVRVAILTQSGEVYIATYVDLECSDTYDLALHRWDLEQRAWSPAWARSFGIGEDVEAEAAWAQLRAEPHRHATGEASP